MVGRVVDGKQRITKIEVVIAAILVSVPALTVFPEGRRWFREDAEVHAMENAGKDVA